MPRSKSNDLLRSNGTIDSLRSSNRFSNFKALKQWGKHRLKLSITKSNEARIDECAENETSQITGNNNSSNDSVKSTKSKPKSQAEKMLKQNPLYSSSEKLFPANIVETAIRKCATTTTTTNPVKLRTSMTRRQRRNKQYRCEEPNSSSGNWSASSESGRTSASSEIVMHNKSSASCTSLNHNSKPPVTLCPPSLTKRRINTSTSSSITSDETLTHDVPSSGYVDYDDETSSMYSCDTEGYFTSFHVDSGLKTLKEEEVLTAVPAMLSTSALINEHSVSSSIGDMSRTNNSISDSDYELFGKGSTSTTASSAGTVCTTLLGSLSNNSLVETPQAPERKSSLNSRLNNISNYAKPKVLLRNNDSLLSSYSCKDKDTSRLSLRSPLANMDSMNSSVVPLATISDVEISENSDFEGVEHIKRMQGKTKINSNRIPSICVITPSHSDDEDRVAAMESMLSSLNINQNKMLMRELDDDTTVAQVHAVHADENDNNLSDLIKWTPKVIAKRPIATANEPMDDEYVTITDVAAYPNAYRFDENIDNLNRILSGDLNVKTEYVSLNELPGNVNYDQSKCLDNGKSQKLIAGTNVMRNAHGMFVYETNTLKYKRSLCTTFKGISSDDVNKPSNIQKTEPMQKRTTVAEHGVSSNSSPPFDRMVSDGSSQHGLEDVYVTLAVDRKSTTKNAHKVLNSTLDKGE